MIDFIFQNPAKNDFPGRDALLSHLGEEVLRYSKQGAF